MNDFARRLAILAAAVALAGAPAPAQNCGELFDELQVLDLHVTMDPTDWDALRTSCPAGVCGPRPHSYWPATLRCEDGPEIQVGIRRKNGKADPSEADPRKPAIKIDVNEFVPGQTFYGMVKLNLENGSDSSGGTGNEASNGNGIREGVSWTLFGDAGVIASRAAWSNLWVNGELVGLYTHVEQVDKEYLIARGIDEGGWLFKGPSNDQRTRESEPNPFAFNWYPFDHVNPADPQPPDWRDQSIWRVDLQQVFALAAVTNFVGNKDAVVFKNNNYWYYDWQLFPDGQQPRLYLPWDLDTTMGMPNADEPVLGTFHNNGHMAQALLRDDPAFQATYYQTYAQLMEGPLSLASTLARVNALQTVLAPHIDADPNQAAGSAQEQFDGVRAFLQARTAFVLGELGACPDGTCDGSETSCSCPADCGSPPATESVCSDAIDEDCDNTIDCADADCGADPACESVPPPNAVIVNEVVSNTADSPDLEWIELRNDGPGAQDLTGWYVLDDDNAHDPCYLEGSLQPGEYLVVAGFNGDFVARYPDAAASLNVNQFDSTTPGVGFGLSDAGDHVRLFRPTPAGDEFVDGFTLGPQGEGIPFGYVPEGSDAPEYVTAPTPAGSNDLAAARSPVCINEFLTTSQSGGVDDWIELFNRGAAPVDIGGWSLSDTAANPTKYSFPAGTVVPPGDYLTVDETTLGFALSSTGSEVIVLTHADGVTGQDYYDFGTQFPDVSEGRFPDGAPYWIGFETTSRGGPNACRADGLRFESSSGLVWGASATATSYDLVRGELDVLRSSGGAFDTAVTACLANDLPATGFVDGVEPAAGAGLFYLVRPVGTACGGGTYDSGSPRQAASRDAGISASVAGCP